MKGFREDYEAHFDEVIRKWIKLLNEEIHKSFSLVILLALFNAPKLSILPAEYICVFLMVLTINSDCFPKQH
jgi:hypothetical protein